MYLILLFNSGGDANFVISSSLTGFFPLHGAMAPMIHDGYGIFYTIENDRCVEDITISKFCFYGVFYF